VFGARRRHRPDRLPPRHAPDSFAGRRAGITECSRRITGCEKPLRHSRSATSASGARPRLAGMGATATPREDDATQIRVTSHARTTRPAKAWAKLMARAGEEFPRECPACGSDIRLIACRLVYECETIPGLRTLGNLRLLQTSCPRAGADPEDPHALGRAAGASARLAECEKGS
jgi:hypothetical protein